jgi:hypothetical protein
MLRALALAAVLAAGDSTGTPAPAPTEAPSDSMAWIQPIVDRMVDMAMSLLASLDSMDLQPVSRWSYEIGIAPGGSSGESVGLLRPRDGQPPFLPIGSRRPWAPSLGIRFHVHRNALIGLSYAQNSIDYGWDDVFAGGSSSLGKATVGTVRVDLLYGFDPLEYGHHGFGGAVGPTIAFARARGARPNPHQADSVFVEGIETRTAVSYGLLLRGEHLIFRAMRAGADLTLWVRNGSTLLDVRTAPAAAYDGDRVKHWPQLLRLWLAYRW